MTWELSLGEARWPRKRREMHNHHIDSTIWNDFVFRDDDVIIASYAKSGTTWTQQIVGQLIFEGAEDVNVADLSPWVDMRIPPKAIKLPMIEAQTHRRFLKTHLPVDALVFSPKARYIYLARDGRDVAWSMFNHHKNANQLFYDALNNTPGRVGPPIEPPPPGVETYFREWLERDGHPFWSFWDNVRSWWEIRHLPNVLMVHFADLKQDVDAQIRRIADFLDIDLPSERWSTILEHCSFEWMKAHASLSAPLGGLIWEGGAETFLHKGTNGRWRD
ncbi:MAG: sulfotransferase domain-containing protein, partial [Sphingomonadales bacterium]